MKDTIPKSKEAHDSDAVLVEVLCEMVEEAGGPLRFGLSDPVTLDEIVRRLRAKGINPSTGDWIN
jgi:hypothetical protein